jgi:hypothetical protein
LFGADVECDSEARKQQPNAGAVDVIDAGYQEDESDDPPAQSAYHRIPSSG